VVHRARLLIRRFEDAPQARPFAGLSFLGSPAMVDSTLDRTTIDVEKAAKLRTVEGPHGPVFAKHRPLDRPHTGEYYLIVPTLPGDDDEAAA
jgi:hypothetical protein